MAPPTHATFDFNQLTFGATTMPTRAGGKCVRVGYGPTGSQVEFQLGTMQSTIHIDRISLTLDGCPADTELGKHVIIDRTTMQGSCQRSP